MIYERDPAIFLDSLKPVTQFKKAEIFCFLMNVQSIEVHDVGILITRFKENAK
jgi:hypothetical protein